jgi:hypothetical protein
MTAPLTPDDLFQVFQWSCESISRRIARTLRLGSPRPEKDPELPRLLATNAALGCAFNVFVGHLDKAEDHLRDLRRHLKKVKEDKAAQASQN